MPAFQIVVGGKSRAGARSSRGALGARGIVDLLVDGANLTARLADAEVVPLLRDLGDAALALAAARCSHTSVTCLAADEPWEMGLERAGADVLFSLYRGGPSPEIAVFERRVEGDALLAGLASAIDRIARTTTVEPMARELLTQRDALAQATWTVGSDESVEPVLVEPEGDAPLRFSADMLVRAPDGGDDEDDDPEVERADLLGMLVRGSIRVTVADRTRELGDAHPCLVAEQLVAIADGALDAWEAGRAWHRRVDAAGVLLAARVASAAPGPDAGTLTLTVGGSRTHGLRNAWTFPRLDVPALGQAAVAFGRAVVRALVRRRPAQARNLRLSALRRAIRELDERLSDAARDDAKVNASAEGYRAFAAMTRREARPESPLGNGRMRYAPRWTAAVPGLDLRATFLCGDRILVGGARETACLDRATGTVLWREATARAVSIVTPAGLARIHADGQVAIHDFGTGEITQRTRVAPRVGGAPAGAVVNAPGLPRLLVVTEGERHLSAIDLASGELRWRHAARRAEGFRIRRAGKLLIVASGDPTLSALDATTGDVVWRVRDARRFRSRLGLDHDALFAIAGEGGATAAQGSARLHHLDPYSGASRWVRELPAGVVPQGAPLVSSSVVAIVTRDRRGLGLLALDRETGETAWSVDPGFAPVSSAWLAVDDLLVCNGASGHLEALSLRSGASLWRHAFPRALEGDEPRRLEPVLRSGALFVPQQDVHVVRPRDGEVLGHVAAGLVPDLLRVDERCDVFVAEESGHLAAFAAGPRLSLVAI